MYVDEIANEIEVTLRAIRESLEQAAKSGIDLKGTNRDEVMRVILACEEMRLRFSLLVRSSHNPEVWEQARSELLESLSRLLGGYLFGRFLRDLPFRANATAKSIDSLNIQFRESIFRRRVSVEEALGRLRELIEAASPEPRQPGMLPTAALRGIVPPRQQVAPVQFEIRSGRLAISNQPPLEWDEDAPNIASALAHIREEGKRVLMSLENSNCDKRLLESVSELHAQVTAKGNVVKIGLTNIACGIMSSQFERELPDALNGLLSAYTSSISMYVAQFPEWEQFSSKAAQINLSHGEIEALCETADKVVRELKAQPELTDPEVPKTISFIRSFVSEPKATTQRAGFALLRTLENLVGKVFRYGADLLDKTASKASDALSTAGSRIIVGLLSVALLSATGIASVAAKAGEPWVRQAAEIVKRQIDKL
jgi:hypothetical protein